MSTNVSRRQKFVCVTCGQKYFTFDSNVRKKKTHVLKTVCSQCDNALCSPIQPEKKETEVSKDKASQFVFEHMFY